MCAVIGAVIQNPVGHHFDMLKRVFLESKIRGLHATGLSYVKHDKVYTEKMPVPADKFPFDFAKYVNEDGNLYLVGHCRYSTSDLEYNQPISNDNFSVVHNGVVSQELPEHWKELYGYTCSTKNDTELLLHTLEDGISPMLHWKDASLAVCELHKEKKIRAYRNGKRPIYLTCNNDSCIITSTKDIAERAGLPSSQEIMMGMYVTIDNKLAAVFERVDLVTKDLQHCDENYYNRQPIPA